MSDAERITIKAFDTVDEAKDGERLLLERGLRAEVVSRKGKKLKVTAEWEDQARALLNGEASTALSAVQSTLNDGVSTVVGAVQPPVQAVIDGAQQAASKVADVAQNAAGAVTDSVQHVSQAVGDRVETVVDVASEKVGQLAGTVRQYGTDDHASSVRRRTAATTANALDRTAYYLQQGDVTIVLDDLRNAIRRHPGRSLLLGLGLGYIARTTLVPGEAADRQASSDHNQVM